MPLTNDTTLPVPGNGTTLRQQNWNCIFINSNAERISKLCAYCFILMSSFFGNIFIIVYKHRDLRKTINYFIVNMAVSDLLLSLVVIPDQINQMVTDSFHWLVSGVLGLILCKLYIFTTSVSLLVSVQSLVWIAIDRFVAVVFPIKLGLITGGIRTKAIISTWIFAGVFYFPLLVTSGLAESGNNTFCASVSKKTTFLNKGSFEAYNWLHLTIRIFAPLFLITILYTAIAITLKRRRKALANTLPNVPEQRYLKKRRQATQMVIVILVLFYICVIPHTLLHFVYLWKHSCAFLRSFYSLAIFLLLLSSVVNPIICLSFVESYRRGLKNIMCYFCAMQDNKRVKRERITLKRIRNLSGKNCEGTSKDSNNFQEPFDILQKVQ